MAPIESFPPEKWDAILALNLSAAFHAIRASFADMKARGWGRIINVASAHGLVASPFKSAYVAAKHGLIGLTKTVALEGAEHGVTVNAICPGYVWTPLVEKQIDDQARSHGISRDRVIKDVLLAQAAEQDASPRLARSAPSPCSCHRRGTIHHRHRPAGRWRLDGTLKAAAPCAMKHGTVIDRPQTDS